MVNLDKRINQYTVRSTVQSAPVGAAGWPV